MLSYVSARTHTHTTVISNFCSFSFLTPTDWKKKADEAKKKDERGKILISAPSLELITPSRRDHTDKRRTEERERRRRKKKDRSFSAKNARANNASLPPARAQEREREFFQKYNNWIGPKIIPKITRTSTDCKSPSVSFTGPVTSAAEIALIWSLLRLLLLLLLFKEDFLLLVNCAADEVVGEKTVVREDNILFIYNWANKKNSCWFFVKKCRSREKKKSKENFFLSSFLEK